MKYATTTWEQTTRWIVGRVVFCRNVFGGDPDMMFNSQVDYTMGNRLLVMISGGAHVKCANNPHVVRTKDDRNIFEAGSDNR